MGKLKILSIKDIQEKYSECTDIELHKYKKLLECELETATEEVIGLTTGKQVTAIMWVEFDDIKDTSATYTSNKKDEISIYISREYLVPLRLTELDSFVTGCANIFASLISRGYTNFSLSRNEITKIRMNGNIYILLKVFECGKHSSILELRVVTEDGSLLPEEEEKKVLAKAGFLNSTY